MTLVRLRHIAQINPATPAFDRLPADNEVTFLPMESVWPDARLDVSQRRLKSAVSTGYTRFQEGDVLVPKITPTFEAGRSVLINGLHNGVGAGTTELHVLRAGPRLDPRFLLYLVNTHNFLKLGKAEMYGVAGQQRVPDDFIRNLPVSLPPIHEQRRIADFLDAETDHVSRMQEATTWQSTLLQEHLLESIRVATTAGTSKVRPTGIPWMPYVGTDWRLLKVSHIFRTGSGTTPSSEQPEYYDGPYPWINSADLNNGEIQTSQKSVTGAALRDFPALKLHPVGSLVIALYGQGATKGRTGILRIPACLNQACCALVPTGGMLAEYAAYWFRAHKEGIIGLAYGAGQPNLSQELIKQLRIPMPGPSTQRKIVENLQEMEEEAQRKLAFLARRRRLLTERRQALITAAVTGKFDVTAARARA